MAHRVEARAAETCSTHGALPLSIHAVGVGVGRARLAGHLAPLSELVHGADITRSVLGFTVITFGILLKREGILAVTCSAQIAVGMQLRVIVPVTGRAIKAPG
jgi:hypothetical protein